ncbi:putative 5'-AMP-activated protein kinase, regulatory beta subunit [Monocercomonoides exilis]|uniref:putative 5'-AMP-activated protein kinase, regulatory beta subunit n=1 Tax=Monocercomonoides exilis TaxID=2049356 RepID=UPI003559EB5E|nr:putative 5'-AMP-activated protein kinase, regulatory beta subunit [Monocercomonoides exilis]
MSIQTKSTVRRHISPFIRLDRVAKPTVFSWPSTSPLSEVYIVGDWDGWKRRFPLVRLTETGEVLSQYHYYCVLNLPNGKYNFKFIVDEKWTVKDSLPMERDSVGNINNVAFVSL